jgi:uncharacterized protein (DUF433 family)
MKLINNDSKTDEHFSPMISHKALENKRFNRYLRRYCPTAKDFQITLRQAYDEASRAIPSIVASANILGGSPCVRGTRVPVYMILDAVEYHGTLEGVLQSYPKLNMEQVKDAVRFAGLVMERPVDNKIESLD